MNKSLLAVLFVFSICSLYGNTNLGSTACQKLIAKPVVFMQNFGLISAYSTALGGDAPIRILEIRDADIRLKDANDPLEAKIKDYNDEIRQLTQSYHNSNGNYDYEKWQSFYQTKIELVQQKINDLILEQNKLSHECSSVREAVNRKIAIIAENIAKELGACAVINPFWHFIETYIDPAYDITERVINQLNAEYLAKNETMMK